MNITGLHHQISMKRLAAAELARQARRPACDPRTAYEKGLEAERLDLQAAALVDHAAGNEQAMEGLMQMINYLQASPHQSRHRSVAVTQIENAVARLLLENGSKDAPPATPEIYTPKKKKP